MKKYLPIRVFSTSFGYGWWFGRYFFFVGRHATDFAIVPMAFHYHHCEYASTGRAINAGDIYSWSVQRQKEKHKKTSV